MNSLIGKTIAAIQIASDRKAIRFQCEGGEEITARADGDCCSDTWVEGVEGADAILGSPVLAVVDLEMPDLGSMEGKDVVAYYGCKITTAKGECVIDYRNDSNGYYGGNLSWPDDEHSYFYGGVYGQNVSKEQWTQLAPAPTD